MSCLDYVAKLPECKGCGEPYPTSLETIKISKNGRVYFDNRYIGKMTELNDSGFKVICKNNNRYLKGTVIEFKFV